MPLASGTKLGPYEVVSAIGAGGMGEVYRAKDSRLGRNVAIKVLPESFARDSDRLLRFEQEARAVATLNHPNILAIHDVGEQNGSPYLVSELLEGDSLRVELEQARLGSRKAVDYAVQIAQGLAAAHERNIVHRDLKPDNVFITRDGRVKILDFGLAKLTAAGELPESATLTNAATEPGKVMGTVGYMAPEQVRGASVDSRTDIFSLGAVLYEMVSGQQAFRRDTAAETMTAILKEDPELSETTQPVSPGMQRIIARCLEKKPEQRFQSAKDLAFALEAITGTGTKSAASHAIIEEAKRSRRPWVLIAGIPLALTVGAILGWLLRPTPAGVAPFRQASFHRGEVIRARFAPDGKTLVYSAKLNGGPVDTYVLREDYPEPVAAGLKGAIVEAISRQGQMAVLVNPQYFAHKTWQGTLATTPMGGSAPREIMENVSEVDWAPDGSQMAVISHPVGEINGGWQLQYPIGKTLWQGENWISDVRVSPDGSKVAYFRHPPNVDDRGQVMVIDGGGNPRALSSDWESLAGLAWSPSGNEIWFSASGTGQQYCIHAVDLSGKERTAHCGAAPTVIQDFAASGRALVMAEQSRISMAAIEHGSNEEKDLTWLDFAYNPRLSADGSEILFTDQTGQSGSQYNVYVRKRDGSPAVRIGENGFGSDITADGKFALMVKADDPLMRVQIVPVGPGEKSVLHWDGVQPIWAQWFHDGEHILLVASSPPGHPVGVYVTDRKGTQPKLITEGAFGQAGASPDGAWIVYLRGGKTLLQRITGGEPKELPNIPATQVPIAWGTDEEHVFIQENHQNEIRIARLDLKTGKIEPWQVIRPRDQIGLRANNNPVAITPDGKSMAYAYGNELDQLYVSDGLK
jgi:Tol biopolymer transport system component